MPDVPVAPLLVLVEHINLQWPSGVSQHVLGVEAKALLEWLGSGSREGLSQLGGRPGAEGLQPHSCHLLLGTATAQESQVAVDVISHPRVTMLSAKSLQSCLTLCDPIDGSPPGFPIPGILQARTLEWVALSFSKESR